MKKNMQKCPCGSGKAFSDCCEKFLRAPKNYVWGTNHETILFDWLNTYSKPIINSFIRKTRPYVFRISSYLDCIIKEYFDLEVEGCFHNKVEVNDTIFSIKNNILHSLLASFVCACQGLFLQSGTQLRSMIEDCLVLIDFSENPGQLNKYLKGKYSTNNLLTRVKPYIPQNIVAWYGCFSANYTHFGPLHSATYLPTGCYGDNYVLVIVLRNLVRAIVSFHIVLERIHFNQIESPILWSYEEAESKYSFCDNSQIFDWAEELGNDIVAHFPPDERKEGFIYSSKQYIEK